MESILNVPNGKNTAMESILALLTLNKEHFSGTHWYLRTATLFVLKQFS